MASPQVENGYTRVANELLEAIARHPFTAHQLRIVLFVLRETYGYGLKSKRLSLDYIADGIGMDRAEVSRDRAKLVAMGVLCKTQPGTNQEIGIIKNYEGWVKHNVVQSTTKRLGKAQQNTLCKAHPIKKELQRKKERTPIVPLPDPPAWLDAENWSAWVEIRKAMKKPLTAHSASLCLKKLERWKGVGYDANAILEASVVGGWQGLFPPKAENGNGRPKSKQQADSDYFKGRIREELGRADQSPASPDDPDRDIPF